MKPIFAVFASSAERFYAWADSNLTVSGKRVLKAEVDTPVAVFRRFVSRDQARGYVFAGVIDLDQTWVTK